MKTMTHPTNGQRLAAARQKVSSMAADAQVNVRAFAGLIRGMQRQLQADTSIDSRLSISRLIGEYRTQRNIFIGQLRQLRQLLAMMGEGSAL